MQFWAYIMRLLLVVYSFGEVSWVQGKKWYGNDSAKKLDWDPQDPVSYLLLNLRYQFKIIPNRLRR